MGSSITMEKVETKNATAKAKMHMEYMPGFARFLLDNKLEPYVKENLRVAREVNYPLLKYFDFMPEEQLLELSTESTKEFLTAAIENKLEEHHQLSMERWITNQLPLIARDQIVVEDITLAGYLRKKVMLKFVHEYTSDTGMLMQLVDEIDRYVLETESDSFSRFLQMQQQQLNDLNAALRNHEERLLEAQRIAEIGSFEWDLVNSTSTYTAQVASIFELEGKSNLDEFMQYVHPSDRGKVKAALDKAIGGGGIYECEYRYQRNNKEKVIWSRGIVSFHDGKPLVMKGTVMDVTGKHLMIKRLERSEELYKQAQELTHIGNWSWEIGHDRINWSDELYRIYGLEPQSETISFERFTSLIHPDDRQNRVQEIQQSLAGKAAGDYTMRIVTDAGEVKVISGKNQVLVDEAGIPYKMLGTCQDITNEYLLRRRLEEEKTFAEILNDTSVDIVAAYDKNLHLIAWNRKSEEKFGLKKEEVLGRHIKEVFPYLGNSQIIDDIQSALKGNTIHYEDQSYFPTAGYFESFFIPIKNKSGEVFAALSLIHDITEIKNSALQLSELNQLLEVKNKELERSNRELTSFSYVASHDLKEPLRKIKTFSSRIMENDFANLSDTGKDFFKRINTSASRMQKLIDDLLSFSRIHAYGDSFEAVDLNNVIGEIKNAHEEAILENKLIIESAELPVVKGISFQFYQLFENIIGNAVKYAKTDVVPQVTISVKDISGHDFIKEGADGSKQYCQIIVRDNGIGFEQEYAHKIFDVFQRLHSKNEYSGTGIGLAICKKIVQNHNGFIYADSRPDEGATFYICLPK